MVGDSERGASRRSKLTPAPGFDSVANAPPRGRPAGWRLRFAVLVLMSRVCAGRAATADAHQGGATTTTKENLMSAFIDHLATLIEDSNSDADTTSDDWQAAIKRVFPSAPEATREMETHVWSSTRTPGRCCLVRTRSW